MSAAYPNKSTVSVSEFCHFMEWASALASQEDAEHAVADQVGKHATLSPLVSNLHPPLTTAIKP